MHDDDDPISNYSNNRPFDEVLTASLKRRKLLKGGATLAAGVLFFGHTEFLQAFDDDDEDDDDDERERDGRKGRPGKPLLGFTAVAVAAGGGIEPAISVEYEYDVILPWGEPLVPGGPAFSLPMTPDKQAAQVGIGHDGMWFFPLRSRRRDDDDDDDREERRASNRGVLCMNNEFGSNYHVLRPEGRDRDVFGNVIPNDLNDVRVSQHAHGVTVVELRRRGRKGKWQTVNSPRARRIHVNTLVEFSGPAASHPDLQNNALNPPMGTVNNCANGHTPWGTYLTCEENFNGYFGTDDVNWQPSERQNRYGINSRGFGYYWHRFDPRFDLANPDFANEPNRFGWVVEIDPMDPDQNPIKRTALGRKKNEGATVHEAEDGRIVVYNGDDERFDYVYKYVSAQPWRKMRRQGESPLDRGPLYAARFNDDGSGDWLELSLANPKIAAEFSDYGEMLINARRAADLAGATPMDRPEWITVANDDRVYLALTNNSRRDDSGDKVINGRLVDSGPDAANPLAPNSDGHIIRWREVDGHSGTRFQWDIFVFAEDTHGTEASFADPDGLWADPDGRLFIQTDGGQKDSLNNQMLVADPQNAEIKRLFTGVPGCEITGITVTPDRRTMFVNVQHPGNGDPANSNFPAAPGSGEIPRDATVVITRKNNGVIGS